MKLVLFDLGQTLEDGDVLLPGALETLEAIQALRDGNGPAALLGLVSDFDMPGDPSEVPEIQQRYYALLDHLGIRSFFEPVAERVTLSTEVGVFKPDEAVFRAAVAKAGAALTFSDVLFVTENRGHVLAARRLGLTAVHLRGPGHTDGEVDTLPDIVPLVREFAGDAGDQVETVVVVGAQNSGAGPAAAAAGLAWTLLGEVLVVSGPAARVQQFVATTGAAPSLPCAVPRQHLHLVTQIGRLFQEAHPEVPVVVDKGRYLVVALEPGASELLDRPEDGHHAVRPLPTDAVVFDQRPAATRSGAAPAVVDRGRAEDLSRATFEGDLLTLVGFGTRHSTSAGMRAAVDWARDELTAHGHTTEVQTLPVGAGTTRNLIADRPGLGDERGVVIVTAHLDSVNLRGGPAAAAPGADDNASGAAGVLAIGRALAGHTGVHDLRLILFGGEEQGLFGSRHYVAGLSPAERARIRVVVNMDMISGRNTETPTVLLEGAAVSQEIIDALAAVAGAHTSLVVQTSLHPFNSDHVPFLERGIPTVLTIEGADGANARVHTELDTVESCDVDLALEILRMNLTFVARALDDR